MIKVFIGTEPKTEIARKVLEYSIRKHTKIQEHQIQFIPMMGEDWKVKPITGIGTGFSLFRWDIPRRCDYKGYAIYLDADILCLDDIQKLYTIDTTLPSKGNSIWCTYQKSKWYPDKDTPETSVMLIDCEKAEQNQATMKAIVGELELGDPQRKRYIHYMRAINHHVAPICIPNKFNSLNAPLDDTVFLHYTKEPEQPWYNPDHAYANLWSAYFEESLEGGIITKDEVKEAISKYIPHTKKERGTGLHPSYKRYIEKAIL